MFIVFITAFINYTLEGYKVDAVRYIKEDKGMVASIYECLDAIYERMNYSVPKRKFNFREGARMVSLERILYIESNLHRLEFHVMEESLKKYTLSGTLNKLEAEFFTCTSELSGQYEVYQKHMQVFGGFYKK